MLKGIITYLQRHSTTPLTKWLCSYNYFFRLLIPELFFLAYKDQTQKQIIKSTEACACSVCDNNYVPGLIILIESILEYNSWFNLPFYIFMDSDKKIDPKNQQLLLTIYPHFYFLDLEESFREIKSNNKHNIRFNRFSQTYLGLSAFNLTKYKTVLSLDTDILCQGNFKILTSDKIKGDFIAVSDSQRPYKTIEYFREQNQKKSFISIESTKKPYQVNTGVYVIHEKLISTKVYEELFHLAKEGITNGEELGGDQEIINYYLEKKKGIILTYAPFIYNTSVRSFAGNDFDRINNRKPVFIHYVGNKPWSSNILLIGKLKKIRLHWINYAKNKLNEIHNHNLSN